jgi:hypothetical protein
MLSGHAISATLRYFSDIKNTGGGAILPKVFCTPFVLRAYITGIILAKNGDFA